MILKQFGQNLQKCWIEGVDINTTKQIPKLLLLIVIMLIASGCNNNASNGGKVESELPETATGFKEYFQFYPNDYASKAALVLDQYGNIIPEDKQFTVLYDMLTGEPQCQTLEVVENTGKVNEYGGIIVKRSTALFDKDGNQISEYMDIGHHAAFGDFVILAESNWQNDTEKTTALKGLWNFKTGKLVLEDVGRLDIYDAEKKLFVASKASNDISAGEIIGIIDETGALISTPKTDEKYWLDNTLNGMIIASKIQEIVDGEQNIDEKPNTQSAIFTKDFEQVFTAERIWSSDWTLYGDYITYTNDQTTYICNYNFNTCFEYDRDDFVNYFDGECMIKFSRDSFTGESTYSLNDVDSNILADNLAEIYPIVEESDKRIPAESFLAIDKKGIYIYNRKGEIIETKLQNDITSCSYLGGGYITYILDTGKTGLLDLKLKTVVEPDKYNSISRGYSMQGGFYNQNDKFYYCSYNLDSNERISRIDLLDSSFKPIISNISSYFRASDDLIAIEKGFSMGLIDYKGNWIFKHSIFSEFEMEDSACGMY